MSTSVRLCTAFLLATGLAACSTSSDTVSSRDEHHYAFARPAAPAAAVVPVAAPVQPGRNGPANAARIVYFDFDDYSIRSSERSIVEAHAQWLRSHPQRSVTLHGHTDARGDSEYNQALGQKRADAVRESLQLLGVGADRVKTVSYDEERLADPGSSEQAHQRNRRVEFDYR